MTANVTQTAKAKVIEVINQLNDNKISIRSVAGVQTVYITVETEGDRSDARNKIGAALKKAKFSIEEKLSTLIPRRYFVFGLADDNLGEKVVLYVEGEPLVIDESTFNVLTKFEKPKEIIFIPKFKETATGKIMRKDSLKSLA